MLFLLLALGSMSCSLSRPAHTGSFAYLDSRRVVIVGENVAPALAQYYQRRFKAPVWYTPFEGKTANVLGNFLKTGLGPSRDMRDLMRELQSINGTVGRWEIIVPKIAEKYFTNTLANMPSASLSKTRGLVVVIDSPDNAKLEAQLERVSAGNMFVTYEFQQDPAP